MGHLGWAVLALLGSVVAALRPEHLPLGPNAPGYAETQPRRQLISVAEHYKSVGRLGSPFFGSISSYGGLLSALESCSFKREIVLVPTMGNSMDAVFQLAAALGHQGIAHILIISTTEEGCQHLDLNWPTGGVNGVGEQGLCCGWDYPRVPPRETNGTVNRVATDAFSNHRLLMHLRLRTAARVLRMGFGALFLDTDLIIFDSPYRFLKVPPFADKQLMASGTPTEINIGVMYAGNGASSDGPTAWVFADAADRQLRWAEDGGHFIMTKTNPVLRNIHHMTWDQSIFSDSVLSAILGRPAFRASWQFWGDPPRHNLTWDEYHAKLLEGLRRADKAPSNDLAHLARSDTMVVQFCPMRVPSVRGVWPPELGGQGFPTVRGPYSREWQGMLRQVPYRIWKDPDAEWDTARCGNHPFPRDLPINYERWPGTPEPVAGKESAELKRQSTMRQLRADVAAAGAGAGGARLPADSQCEVGKVEKVAFLPTYAAVAWSYRPEAQDDWSVTRAQPAQVVGHVLFIALDKKIYKNGLKQAYGWYNWTLGAYAKDGLVYHASTPAVKVPKVLAPHPGLVAAMAHMQSMPFLITMRSLVKAAALAGRALAWPDLPCPALKRIMHAVESGHRADRRTIPWRSWYFTGALPHPISRRGNDSCLWYDYMHSVCLDAGAGLLPYEFDHLLSTLPAGSAEASPSNTLFPMHPLVGGGLEEPDKAVAAAAAVEAAERTVSETAEGMYRAPWDTTTPLAQRLAVVGVESYTNEAKRLEAEPVVYLGRLLDVTDQEALGALREPGRGVAQRVMEGCVGSLLPASIATTAASTSLASLLSNAQEAPTQAQPQAQGDGAAATQAQRH